MDRLISLQAAIDAYGDWYVEEGTEEGFIGTVKQLLEGLPSAQPEITEEQAIEHLQSTGWMQNHDREMYDMGLKKQLADDSGSYDSLLPSAQPKTIRCKECKHQIKEWRDDKRLKDKGYWVYGCKVISDICGYWALFGQDDDFCSEAERKTDGTD